MKTSQDSSLIGQSFPIGSTLKPEGVNFCIFSKNAERIDLLLFDHVEDIAPKRIIHLNPAVNRTYHYWHIFVPAIKSGQLYAYKVTGINDPSNGHRFDPDKILFDPYAKAVVAYGEPITLAAAKKLAGTCEAFAAEKQWTIIVAIIDTGGNIVLLQKMDNTQIGSIDVAITPNHFHTHLLTRPPGIPSFFHKINSF